MAEKIPNLYVVEDDPTWAAILKGKFGKKFLVSTFADGESALAAITKDRPEIIIQDYNLEGKMTGLDCLREFQKVHPNGQVIMFSAQEDVQIALTIMETGAYDYVVKSDGAHERLAIIIRNIQKAKAVSSQLVELKISVARWKVALYGLIGGVVILLLSFMLFTCPEHRSLKWDPLGVARSARCKPAVAPSPYEAPPATAPAVADSVAVVQ
jgi:CheY-like chemotaxis protein